MSKAVLVVDDHHEMLELMKALLHRAGYEVITAGGAFEALNLLEDQCPDAVVLDIMMPERTGIEVLENIRWNPKLAGLPVICISAARVTGDALEFIKEFSVGLLDKAQVHELPDHVHRVLGSP